MSAQSERSEQDVGPSSSGSNVRIAFLGPPGTYGQQAAHLFRDKLIKPVTSATETTLVPCKTMAEIWSNEAEYLVMPLQNTIHGSVTETIDCLLSPLLAHRSTSADKQGSPSSAKRRKLEKGESSANGSISNGIAVHATLEKAIIADLDLPIEHCLAVKRGTKKEDIRWVRSHEQALGQCDIYLKEHYPKAKLVPWSSTAAAAVSLLEPSMESGAAICSKSVLSLYPEELEVLDTGIQMMKNNFTRFILLSRSWNDPMWHSARATRSSDFFACASPEVITNLILALPSSTLLSIHTRPAPPDPTTTTTYPLQSLVEIKSTESDIQDRVGQLDGDFDDLGSTLYHVSVENQ